MQGFNIKDILLFSVYYLLFAIKMERETGFEPATPTLARLCSTN